eukprot:TRINITY_DN31148_c2_g1_i2.p1 TRINITY_DN31148_c2_g1~~TRINITY_DN31148_c2_g1_i2.p1  ORF type:complete len:105 (-),score=5.39 TRINITY_DN31148_c2_g1_i2:377-691(-)
MIEPFQPFVGVIFSRKLYISPLLLNNPLCLTINKMVESAMLKYIAPYSALEFNKEDRSLGFPNQAKQLINRQLVQTTTWAIADPIKQLLEESISIYLLNMQINP